MHGRRGVASNGTVAVAAVVGASVRVARSDAVASYSTLPVGEKTVTTL